MRCATTSAEKESTVKPVIPKLSDPAYTAIMRKKGEKPANARKDEIVVFWIVKDTECSECREALGKGRFLRLEGDKALCMECADLDHLEFLPRGDTAVTRRASKYSKLRAVVVRWSHTRKRYERQGILAHAEAIRRAEEESLADADLRARRQERAAECRLIEDEKFVSEFGQAIRAHYPGCPAQEATQIAQHACRKYSGRVGRTAAAKEFDETAIRLAVVAHVRHVHTDYDALLMKCDDRKMARARVRDEVSAVVDEWANPRRGEIMD